MGDRRRCRSLPGVDHPDQMAGEHETVVMASRSVQQHSTHDAIVKPSAAQGERHRDREANYLRLDSPEAGRVLKTNERPTWRMAESVKAGTSKRVMTGWHPRRREAEFQDGESQMLNDRTRIGWARNSMLLPNPNPPRKKGAMDGAAAPAQPGAPYPLLVTCDH